RHTRSKRDWSSDVCSSDLGPVTKLTTPFGNRTRSQSSISLTAVRGLSLDGFMTIVQPAAKAGAILRVNIARGKFQGVIAATTPIGFFHTCKRFPPVCEGPFLHILAYLLQQTNR